MFRSLRSATLTLAMVSSALAQPEQGSCVIGTATQFLDVNNVTACVRNNGSLFGAGCDVGGPSTGYVVPAGGAVSPLFQVSLWVGGFGSAGLQFSGTDYGPYEFWPGPLGADGRPVNPADCSGYDRIYKVSRSDIAAYEAGGAPATDLAQWPASLGAPVIDGDGNASNYDLAGGDRPDLQGGDQTLWWVMNDVGNTHRWNGGLPRVGLEVRVQAWAIADPANDHLHNTTFYRYTLVYTGTEALQQTLVGLWMDPDVGGANDDYIGSDPSRRLAYAYNGTDTDEGGYGTLPAAVGVVVRQGLRQANGQDTGLNSVVYYRGTRPEQGELRPASRGTDAYNYMRARWLDGTPFTYGGDAYSTGSPTRFMFPEPPPFYWSEAASGSGANTPGDRVQVLSTGPVTLEPADVQEVDLSIYWARAATPGPGAAVEAVNRLLAAVDGREYTAIDDPVAAGAALAVAPNPVRGESAVTLTLAAPGAVSVAVLDVLGREVAQLHDGPLSAGAHRLALDAERLPAGVYVVRATTPGGTTSRTLTVVR